jgi:hypothetical protein
MAETAVNIGIPVQAEEKKWRFVIAFDALCTYKNDIDVHVSQICAS